VAELVRVAGTRWAVEECFQAAKNETGPDHYQVRRYDACLHATLSMLALAFLQVTAAQRCHMRGDLPGVSRSSIYDVRA
jgi:SRSO17 transposase